MFDEKTIQRIREQATEMEASGRLTNDVLEVIYEKRLFKLFVPEELNGNMTPFPEAVKIFEEAAWIDGSFGWLVQIGSGAGFFSTTISPSVAPEIFSRPDVYIAGSDRPTGIAKKVDGGYLVNGSWPFCSGSLNATTITATCKVEVDGQINPTTKAFIFSPDQIQIEKDWNAFGLKATNSHTIHVNDAFIPEEKTFDVFKPHFHYDHPVYHYPFVPFAEANIAATTIGIARHFFDEAKAHTERKKDAWDTGRFQSVLNKIEQMEAPFKKAAQKFHQAIETSWQTHISGNMPTDEELTAISTQSKAVAHHAVEGAQVIFRYLGMDAIIEGSEINRIYRDLHTASQHKLLVSYNAES